MTLTAVYNKDGPNEQTLVWRRLAKDGVRIDARTEKRFKTQFKNAGAKAAYNTPYKMTKAFIPPKWYMVTLAINKGVPLDQAWSREMKGIVPALAMGQFGMGIKRFNLLRKLMAQCFDLEEEGMDETDPYRYSRF